MWLLTRGVGQALLHGAADIGMLLLALPHKAVDVGMIKLPMVAVQFVNTTFASRQVHATNEPRPQLTMSTTTMSSPTSSSTTNAARLPARRRPLPPRFTTGAQPSSSPPPAPMPPLPPLLQALAGALVLALLPPSRPLLPLLLPSLLLEVVYGAKGSLLLLSVWEERFRTTDPAASTSSITKMTLSKGRAAAMSSPWTCQCVWSKTLKCWHYLTAHCRTQQSKSWMSSRPLWHR